MEISGGAVGSVQMALISMLQNAVAQSMEQATQLALLNIAANVGGAVEPGMGELVDVVA